MSKPEQYQVFDLCLEFESIDNREGNELVHAVMAAVNEALEATWPNASLCHVGGELDHSVYIDGQHGR